MEILKKLFVFVSSAQTEAFKNAYVGDGKPTTYNDKLVFLDGTQEIFVKGKLYGLNLTKDVEALENDLSDLISFVGTLSSTDKSTVVGYLKSYADGIRESIPNASTTADGLMSSEDKTKLDSIESGAQKNTITGVKGSSESSYRTGNVNITKANIGLGNVDNTSDANKPISTATQAALDGKQATISDLDEIRSGAAAGATALQSVPVAGTSLGGIKSGGDITISSAGVVTVNDDSHNHTIANVDGLQTALDGKQATISDLDEIRSGAAAGATALQSVPEATTSAAGLMSAADKTKLNGIESGAQKNTITGVKGNSESSYRTGNVNITAANIGLGNVTNESKSTMFASPTFTGTPKAPTAATGTNTTQIATTAFVQSAIDSKLASNDAMIFKGTIGTDGTVTALPATHNAGWTYKVKTAGTYAGVPCEVGDMIICVTDGTAANNAHWTVVQANVDGAVTGPESSTDAHVAVFDGATGKIIKDSGFTIAKSVPSDAKFTDTTYTAMSASEATTGTATTSRSITAKVLNDKIAEMLPGEATTSAAGLMSAADKTKLNGIESGAQKNTITGVKGNSESSYRTGNVNITKANIGLGNVDNTSDANKPISTATQAALDGKQATISDLDEIRSGAAAGATALQSVPVATTSAAGLMSATDKTKLNGIATGATANKGTVTSVATGTGLTGGPITSSGTISLATVADLTAGSAGPTAAVDGTTSTSKTIAVPHLTVDAYGRVTAFGSYNLTVKNTSYSAMSASEATTGTATSSRVISAKVLNDKIAAMLPGEATDSASGLMTAAEKTKLAGIASGATANKGTVTSVATGTGLTGGTITSTGTISLATVSGLTAGSAGPTAAVDGTTSTAKTIAVPHLTVDAYGRVTAFGSYDLTVKNTSYSAMSASEATTGTSTTSRVITAKVLNDKITERLGSYAALASPTFTGTPKAPTASAGTNTTQIATTAFVTTAVSTKAPTSHASTATTYGVGTTANYGHVKISNGDADTVGTADGLAAGMDHTHSTLAPKASPTFTGTPKAPTASAGTNTTQIATTAFVTTAIKNKIVRFTDKAASTWVADATYENYPYRCDIACSGVVATDFAEVVFGLNEADSGNYAPICNTGSGIVSIWSKTNSSITVPLIVVEKQ